MQDSNGNRGYKNNMQKKERNYRWTGSTQVKTWSPLNEKKRQRDGVLISRSDISDLNCHRWQAEQATAALARRE